MFCMSEAVMFEEKSDIQKILRASLFCYLTG